MNTIAGCRISFALDVYSLFRVYDETTRTDIHACVLYLLAHAVATVVAIAAAVIVVVIVVVGGGGGGNSLCSIYVCNSLFSQRLILLRLCA